MSKELTSRSEDYSQWYNDLVIKGGLADYSAVRGCMVIKPYGFALWENMRDQLDRMFKETGHQNAYFPLFVPKSLFEAEEKNAEGFAKECAVVTHYRLKTDPSQKGKLMVDPEAKLDEDAGSANAHAAVGKGANEEGVFRHASNRRLPSGSRH